MPISPRPFVGGFAWALLDADTQARIGALALEMAAARFVEDIAKPGHPARRAAAAASQKAALGLLDEFLLLDEAGAVAIEDEHGAWKVPSAAGPVCGMCGGPSHRRSAPMCDDCLRPDYDDLMRLMSEGTR